MAFAYAAAVAGVGTVSCGVNNVVVTGVGTNFAFSQTAAAANNQARVGGTITVGGQTRTIVSIQSTTQLTVNATFAGFTAQTFTVQTRVNQTGTDTLNGTTAAPTGLVIREDRGALMRIFDCQGLDLDIQGTLTIESARCQLRNDGSCVNFFAVSGSASGGEIIVNGRRATAANAPFPYAGFDWLGVNGLKIMTLNSTNAAYPAKFTVIDACIRFGGDWLTTPTGNFSRFTTQGLECWILSAKGTGTTAPRLRMDNNTATVDFQAGKTYCNVWLNFGVPQISLKGYVPLDMDGPEVNMFSVATAQRIAIEDYVTTHVVPNYYAGAQIVLYGGAWVRLKNNLLGTNIAWHSISAVNNNVIEYSKAVTAKAQDATGGALSDGYLYYDPVGTVAAGKRAKGGTVDITFDLDQQQVLFAGGSASSEFVYAWDYATATGLNSTPDYFCAGTTKGAESHTFYSVRPGYDKQSAPVLLAGNGVATPTFTHASLPTSTKDIAVLAAITGTTFNFATKVMTVGAGVTNTVLQMYDQYQYQLRGVPANFSRDDDCTVLNGRFTWTGWTIVNNGTITAGPEDYTFGAATVTNNGTISTIYAAGGLTSKTVELTVSAGSSIYVGANATAITRLFNSNVGAGTYRVFYAPSATPPTVLIARELYGSQRFAQVVTLADGVNSFAPVDIPDVGISEPALATVLAYTAIDGPSKRYDRTAAFRLTEQGIKLGQIATRSGTSLEGTFSVVVRDDAPVVYGVTGSVITVKSASYEADSRFIKEVVTGGGTFTAFDTELITIDIEDSNGDSSVLVQGTTGGLVDVWKCVNGTINADYETGTKIASNISAGKFRFTGVNGFKLIFFDKNTLLARDCSMAKGSYTLGWYLYDAPTGGLTQEQNVNFSTMVTKVSDIFNDVNSVTNGFVEATDSLHALRGAVDATPAATAVAVWAAETRTLTSAGSSGATLAEIEASTVLAKVDSAMTLTGSYDAAKTAATQTSVDAVKAKVDTLANADLSGLATAAQVAAMGTPLQAGDYVAPANADIDSIKATVEAIQPTDLSGIPGAVRTELATELANLDVKVSSRSTLTPQNIPAGLSADDVWAHADRTLTVASGLTSTQQQALTDLQTEVGKLLKAADYTTPATPAAIAAQVELAILSEGDGRALLQAIADKIGNENLSAATVAAAVWAATGRTLSAPSGLTTAQLQKLDDLITAVAALQNADLSGIPAAIREELATELAHLDADISSRSTLTAEDIPAGLSAVEVLGAEVEPGVSVKGALRLNNAFVAGKVRGAGSNVEKFSNLAGTHDVIVSTNDAQGNRRDVRINLDD